MHMKSLKEILEQVHDAEMIGNEMIPVRHITMDSREVAPGTLFAAIKGQTTDGHNFIKDATASGATVILCEVLPESLESGVTYVKVSDSDSALGNMASSFYGNPSRHLTLIGVTGTNGKTTIATLLYETFTRLGYRCGLISTIRYIAGPVEKPATHTTPDALRLQQMLKEMVEDGCEYCFMEVSSHAIAQKRIAGLVFAGGIFTNLTHDHLDFHHTFEKYLQAKQAFFSALPKDAFALTSRDDRNGMVMVQHTRAKVFTYSTSAMADFHCRIIENTMDGLQVELNGKRVWLRLTGAFNARNITALYGTATILQFDEEEVLQILSSLDPVEGRFQQFRSSVGITAVVDYAHTPDALRNVLETLREVNRDEGKIITVVGAGGDRDPFKRPLMAKIASDLSDILILTSDNPRSEDPVEILKQMQAGLSGTSASRAITITDRKEAIRTAVKLAKPNDIILVAGKGHEKYQEITGVRHPFDDMAVITGFLNPELQ